MVATRISSGAISADCGIDPKPSALKVDGFIPKPALRQEPKTAFDAAYAAQMVKDHADAVALFQANVENPNSALAAFAGKTLPTLQEHKRMADNLKANLK